LYVHKGLEQIRKPAENTLRLQNTSLVFETSSGEQYEKLILENPFGWWFRDIVSSVRGVISPSGGKCCDEDIQSRLTDQFVCSIYMSTRSRKEISTNADLPLLCHVN
jgi:hypothetical protein